MQIDKKNTKTRIAKDKGHEQAIHKGGSTTSKQR